MCTFFEKQQYQISLFIYAGYFTFRGRVASAFSRMMLPNIAGLIVGSIVLGILIKQNIVKQDISAIELTAIIITNIVYETFLMFLMGYGLIELPRSVWLQGSLSGSLLRAQMKACADFSDISEAQTSMGLCVATVIKTKSEVCHEDVFFYVVYPFLYNAIINPIPLSAMQSTRYLPQSQRLCFRPHFYNPVTHPPLI